MNLKNALIYISLILGGLIAGYLIFGGSPQEQTLEEHVEETHAHTGENGETLYTCSMHPQVRETEPGNCPICGMELIPINDGGAASQEENEHRLTMTEAAVKLAEIQTSPVIREQPVTETVLTGKVTVDERELQLIPAHFHGRVEELYVSFTGEHISRGQKIARVYSPLLFTAQKELLEAYANRDHNPELYRSSRQKLINWKIADWQVDEIIASGTPSEELDIYSHKEGYVLKRHVSVGNHLEMGDLMFEISSLDNLWVIFDAYESSLGELEKGDIIRFTLDAVPGKTFESQIDFIDPTLNNDTRTVAIRSDILNPDADLKPGMLATGMIKSPSSGPEQLMVPKSAVMWTGRRSIVYVKVPNVNVPTFEAREVVLGNRAGDYYIIESGLSEREEVVTNGTFKIDSAAQIADKLSMMNREPGSGAVPVHNHGEMEVKDSDDNQTEENHSNH